MRPVACVLLVLFVLGLVATVVPLAPPAEPGQPTSPWRRTVDGWERAVWLDEAPPTGRAGLHPLVFAAGELILAVGLPVVLSKIVAFRSAKGRSFAERTTTRSAGPGKLGARFLDGRGCTNPRPPRHY